MCLKKYSYANKYIDADLEHFDPKYTEFLSVRGRLVCLLSMFKKTCILPFALLFKLWKSFIKVVKISFSMFMVLISLGMSEDARRNFRDQSALIGRDAADWALFPIAIFVFLFRHILGVVVHPGLHLKV